MVKKKYFETEQAAKEYAEKTGGTYQLKVLPGYMFVETIYVVIYDDEKQNKE